MRLTLYVPAGSQLSLFSIEHPWRPEPPGALRRRRGRAQALQREVAIDHGMRAHDRPGTADVAVGVAPVEAVLVVEEDGAAQRLRGVRRPFEHLGV